MLTLSDTVFWMPTDCQIDERILGTEGDDDPPV
jgi:hypothetical protein